MNIELAELFDKALRDGVNLFLGAGFSLEASNTNNDQIPLGGDLAKELSKVFGTPLLDLPRVAAIIESRRKEDFYAFLKAKFSAGKFDPSYHNLNFLNIKNIYTTNIDDLIFKIFENSEKYFINDTTLQGPKFRDKKAIDFHPLHGCIRNGDRPLVFTPMAISSSYSNAPRLWDDLLRSIERFPTVFWGYRLNDSGVLDILNTVRNTVPEKYPKWMILHESNPDEEEYFRSVGFKIIIAGNTEMLAYAKKFEVPRTSSGKRRTTKEVFNEEYIPANTHALPVREINDFYLGDAPTWSDIYRPDLYKTSHFQTIQNTIFSQKNVLVIGIPGSGKSTLLMQLAAFTEYDGHKIILEYLTTEKADSILTSLKDEKALIFVDNFTDDVISFLKLHNRDNIKLVGFDREHNFEIISHLIRRDQFKEISVTDLTPIDIQELYSRIPTVIKSRTMNSSGKNADELPSLFEFINLNINLQNINNRYRSLLLNLEENDELLTDFLVLSCYVHNCRSPLSFDMVYSYFRDHIYGYQEIYELKDKLGQLLSEAPLTLIEDEDQDYFSPRSTILAEVVIEEVSSSVLRRVLERFIDNVPPYNIVSYYVFKKRAYDKFIISKAFPRWEEGKAYYERLMTRDRKNPYLLQQGALYLNAKQRYTEAFYWIDKARNLSNDTKFSIRNSHAIILFDANIKKEGVDVRLSLDKSMEILTECYSEDKRKLYHAKKFADHALQYFNVYGDKKAMEYLNQAKKWVNEELKSHAWDRSLKNLSRDLRKLVG